MDFITWLLERTHRQSPVGDLARDVQSDMNSKERGWQPTDRSVDELREHMEHSNAHPNAFAALREASRQYNRSR